ncbi:MAG: hypothetical protein PUB77_01590 [Clostridiales bacterium]|nr:hypothetical protein [Clostridiales bacterium]
MKFFKRPAVAVILTVIIVICSSLISVNAKLGSRCDRVIDGFYDGVRYNRENHPAIADQLQTLCSVADEMTVIAGNYGIDTAELSDTCNNLRLALRYSTKDISYIYAEYINFLSALRTAENALHSTGLSERHMSAMEGYSDTISACVELIDGACYNDTVRDFMRSYDKFPVRGWVEILGITFPEYFS